jgi:ribonuclease III
VDPLRVAELERRLGYRFRAPSLLEEALTHASFANEHPPAADHARLAFLGDAALGLVVADHVIAADPAAAVGELTARRAELVTGRHLARWAVELELGALLRLGRGEDQSGGRTRDSILAAAFEAVLGAIYREGGVDEVRRVLGRLAAW